MRVHCVYLFTDNLLNGDINIGNVNTIFNVNCGINSSSDSYFGNLHAPNVYAGTSVNTTFLDTPNTTDTPYLWPYTTGQITIGTATIIEQYVCTASNHLANKGYVDSMAGANLLPLTNIWTGTSNTYNNKIVLNTIEANTVSACNLFNNATTNGIFIGTSITNGNIIIGNQSTAGSVGDVNLRTLGSLNLGNYAGIINMGTNMIGGNFNICNSSTFTGLISIAATTPTSGVNVIDIGSLSTNVIIDCRQLVINSARDIGITAGTAGSGFRILSNSEHNFARGISFTNSNMVADKIVYGSITTTSAIGGQNLIVQSHTFPNSFPVAPTTMTISIYKTNTSADIVPTVTAITTTGFTTSCRCITNGGVAANSYYIMYIVIGNAV